MLKPLELRDTGQHVAIILVTVATGLKNIKNVDFVYFFLVVNNERKN